MLMASVIHTAFLSIREERISCIPLTDPVIEMANISNPNGGIASVIVAGHVYRGSLIPELQGKYIFGTFSEARGAGPNGRLYVTTPGGTGLWSFDQLAMSDYPEDLGQYIKGFGQGLDGEIYVMVTAVTGPTGNSGKVMKLAMVP